MIYRPNLLEPRMLSLGLRWRRGPTDQEGDEASSSVHNVNYRAKDGAKDGAKGSQHKQVRNRHG